MQQNRRRLRIASRILVGVGLALALPYFVFNLYIIFASDYCCFTPWDDVDWIPLIVGFTVAMAVLLVGLIFGRIAGGPLRHTTALWLAAALGWAGALTFGIGSAGSSYYTSSAFGGGAVMLCMFVFGLLAVFVALVIAVCGFVVWLVARNRAGTTA